MIRNPRLIRLLDDFPPDGMLFEHRHFKRYFVAALSGAALESRRLGRLVADARTAANSTAGEGAEGDPS